MVAQKNVSFIGYTFSDALAYPHITNNCIQQHSGNPNEPDHRHNKCPDIEWIDTGSRICRKGFALNGIDRIVDSRDAAADGGRFILDVMGVECLGAGDQAQRALKGEGNHQPHSDNAPQKDGNPFRCFFQREPEQHHRQNQPACGDAHVQGFQE